VTDAPDVSIIVLSYFNPEITEVCLRTLQITDGISYEVVVVDNGSDQATLDFLRKAKDAGQIDILVEEPVNHMFSEGNNIGVRHSDPESKYILLLNSDVAFLRPDWLTKLVGWMEGTTAYEPTVWGLHPTIPDPGPRDIVSAGWSHDENVDGRVRPEGWCCLFRRQWWRDLSTDFPWLYGFELSVAESIRAGAKCGVLFNYAPFMVHREGGSSDGPRAEIVNVGTPDLGAWFSGLRVESIDFTLGPNEHSSYLDWSM
jgi:glycosyltransferase involved in cell wall biosynthesis